MRANLYALATITLWGALSALGVSLQHVPPFYLPGVRLRGVHVLAALVGFIGAAIAILGEASGSAAKAGAGNPLLGYGLALISALIWTNYALQTKRLELKSQGFSTAAIGLFGLISGALSLACHAVLEPAVSLTLRDGLLLVIMGLGPLGVAVMGTRR